MEAIPEIETYLIAVTQRESPATGSSRIQDLIRDSKQAAVAHKDQETAKLLWCYEEILKIQDTYLTAFAALRAGRFHEAWGLLERVEIEWHFLERHYLIPGDPHRVRFIAEHSKKFQGLFPYRLFGSMEMVNRKLECSICGIRVDPRKPCGHRKGEIYDGEMCGHRVFGFDVVAIAIVDRRLEEPGHKYSVLFAVDSETRETQDLYKYDLLKYLMPRLQSPFDGWEVESTRRRHPHAHFADVSSLDACPCESGKTYEGCCLREEGVLRPHCDFIFSVAPPGELLQMIEYA